MAITAQQPRNHFAWLPITMILLTLTVFLVACTVPTRVPEAMLTVTEPTAAATAVSSTSTPPSAPSAVPTLPDTPTPEPTEPPYTGPTPAPTFDVSMEVLSFGDITVEETFLGPVTEENSDLYNVTAADNFYLQIPQSAFERHHPEFDYPKEYSEDEIREALSGFGYRIEGEQWAYKLYQGDTLLSDSVRWFRNFQMSPSKTNFSMLVQMQDYQTWRLLHKDGFDLYYDSAPRANPIFAGDDLLTTDIQDTETGFNLVVLKDDEIIYTYPNVLPGPETCPIDIFRAWQDHWVIQVDGESIIDGTAVAAESGYDTAFNWHLVNEKPTYLYQKGDRFGISYDGEELPLTYDYIEHWDCIYGSPFYTFGAHGRDDLLTFFAQRDGQWYFVQAGKIAP